MYLYLVKYVFLFKCLKKLIEKMLGFCLNYYSYDVLNSFGQNPTNLFLKFVQVLMNTVYIQIFIVLEYCIHNFLILFSWD